MTFRKVNYENLVELTKAGLSDAQIARQLGVSGATICRSRQRLGLITQTAAVSGSREVREATSATINAFDEIRFLYRKVQGLIATAEKEKDWDLKLRSIAEARKQLELTMVLLEKVAAIKANMLFYHKVIEVLGREAPDVRDKLIRALKSDPTLSAAL